MVVFDEATHAGPGDTTSPKDLNGISGCFLGRGSRISLEQSNRSCQVFSLFSVFHVIHLVGDVLKPGLRTLDAGDHGSQLGTDDRLGVKRFAKDLSLVGPPARNGQES